ncbi:unnamed protein product [Pylaiella littoralis]
MLLDTKVDGGVEFTALSTLPSPAVNDGRRRSFPRVPAAGSKDWLSSVVEVGKQEAILRDKATEDMGDDEADGRDDSGGAAASDAFFAVDVECVLHKYRRWHECFPRVKPFYAVKCNPNYEVVRVLAMTPGCGFDCASPAEIDQVLACGVDPSRIIYANPCKDVAALEHALDARVATMTFDSKEELHKIRRVLDTRAKSPQVDEIDVQMVLRLRVPDSHSDCPLGEKYGAAEEVCSQLIDLAVELRLPLVGLSFHCGSGCQNAQAYPEALVVAKSIFDLAARQGVELTLLDIGGGFPGWDGSEFVYHQVRPLNDAETGRIVPSPTTAAVQTNGGAAAEGGDEEALAPPAPPLSLADIAQVTLPVLDELFPPGSGIQVIAEPGRYFVEASHLLFARIYAKRSLTLAPQVGTSTSEDPGDENPSEKRKTTAYYIDEGVNGCFKDRVLCGVNFEPCPVSLTAVGQCRTADGAIAPPPENQQQQQQQQRQQPGAGGEQRDPVASAASAASADKKSESAPAPQATALASATTTSSVATAIPGPEAEGQDEDEPALVMGPSGLPADVVARKRLPKSLKPGDWLYFSQMGAYTASIATVSSSAVLEASYCYLASTPASIATSAPGGGGGGGSDGGGSGGEGAGADADVSACGVVVNDTLNAN